MAVAKAVLDIIRGEPPSVAFFTPEPSGDPTRPVGFKPTDVTIFQFWPDGLQDTQSPNYNSVSPFGSSHPLYQWTSNGERTISFEAVFVRELRDDTFARVLGTPSTRFTVDIAGARSRIEQFKQPKYRKDGMTGIVEAPQRLLLCFPNMQLGGNIDAVLCLLKDASFNYQHNFPDGTPRIMSVSLSFVETVQHRRAPSGTLNKGSAIRYHSRERWESNIPLYRYNDGNVGVQTGGGA